MLLSNARCTAQRILPTELQVEKKSPYEHFSSGSKVIHSATGGCKRAGWEQAGRKPAHMHRLKAAQGLLSVKNLMATLFKSVSGPLASCCCQAANSSLPVHQEAFCVRNGHNVKREGDCGISPRAALCPRFVLLSSGWSPTMKQRRDGSSVSIQSGAATCGTAET